MAGFGCPPRVIAVVLVVVPGGTASAQSDSIIGTWKLNVATSKFDPGPPPTGETVVYEPWERDGIQETDTRVLADGTRVTTGFSAHYDGKDYKEIASPDVDTIALTRLDANTVAATLKKSGKVVMTAQSAVSNNGKTRTVTTTGTNAKGQKVYNVRVFDK
jgi:hypothetical protein